jgi:hypothetical protein
MDDARTQRASLAIIGAMQRLRRACLLLEHSSDSLHGSGLLLQRDHGRQSVLLRDLQDLLDVPMQAPATVARQCAALAKDRVCEALRLESREHGGSGVLNRVQPVTG